MCCARELSLLRRVLLLFSLYNMHTMTCSVYSRFFHFLLLSTMHDLSVNAIITRGSRKWFGFSSIPTDTTLWIATVLSHVRPAGMFGLVRNHKIRTGIVDLSDVLTWRQLTSAAARWNVCDDQKSWDSFLRQPQTGQRDPLALITRNNQKGMGENNGRQKCETGRQPNRIPARGGK